MVLLAAVFVATVAYASAGMIMPNNMGGNRVLTDVCPLAARSPWETPENMEEYLNQQMQQQQYETQQMADQIKAQFEAMVRDVTAKKHRFAMSLVAEFVSTCECARSSDLIYQALFIQQAQALNLTDGMDIWDSTRQPYEATNEEDARGLIFTGLFRTMCESAGAFLQFAEQVTNRIPAFQQGKKKDLLN
nr:hypothetical protein BaRGS_030170 [Batillaria attramentaria]